MYYFYVIFKTNSALNSFHLVRIRTQSLSTVRLLLYDSCWEIAPNQPYSTYERILKTHAYVIRTGTVVAQWLRCCATNQKVALSIPDGVIVIFN